LSQLNESQEILAATNGLECKLNSRVLEAGDPSIIWSTEV